jgi:tetratricopeptide (TPR) repeat protein
MRSSLVADAVVFAKRAELTKIATDHLKMKGVSNVLVPTELDDCIDALSRFPKGLLILDWELGAPMVVRVLAFNRKRFSGSSRPILLAAAKVSEQVVAIAAEYSVTQIFTETLTIKNLGARLAGLLIGDSLPDEIRNALAEVYDCRMGGDLKKAISILQRILTKHPTNLRLKCEAAETLLQMNEADKAFKLLEGMERTKPPYLRGIHLLGRCLMRLGRFNDALRTLEQANLFNPHDADRLVDIGRSLLQMDRIQDAVEHFDAALVQDPKHREALIGRGECHLMDGQVNEALGILKDVSGELEMASVFNTCAVMNMRRGRHQQGMSLYEAALGALRKDPQVQARLHFNMGIGYRRWGKKDKAQEAFEMALRLDPSFEKAQGQLTVLKTLPPGATGAAPAKKRSSQAPTVQGLGAEGSFGFGEDMNRTDDFSSDLTSLLDDALEETLFSTPGKKPA